jgi:putative alpha-1,2-mannosidase
VLAALGIFDVQGHTAINPTFQFGSPQFDKVTIQLNPTYYKGKELIIKAENNSKKNVYIQSVSFNRQKIDNCWIDRRLLTGGGTLLFEMGEQPNKKWGINIPPPSMSDEAVNIK